MVSVAVIAGGQSEESQVLSVSRNNDSAQKTTADNKNPEGTGTGGDRRNKRDHSPRGRMYWLRQLLKAAQYDYDGAIELLKGTVTLYSSDTDMQNAVKEYEADQSFLYFMATGRSDTCFLSYSYQRYVQSF